MNKPDRIKTVIATIIVTSVVISFSWLGKDHLITRYLAVGGIFIWLTTMFLLNRKDKKE